LYGFEIWPLTRREERKLRVFENTVLRRIFGPRRDEVTGEWRRLHKEELNGSLEQLAKKCTELRGEYVEQIPSLVASFLPGRAKELSAPQ